jgi:hypothetical protein
MRSRRRLLIIVTLALVMLLFLGGGLLLYLSRSNADKKEEFKESANVNWTKISDLAGQVGAALARVNSTTDLENVSRAAEDMTGQLTHISGSLDKARTPAAYEDLSAQQKDSIKDLKSYLEKVSELASRKDEKVLEDNRGILENRSRKAASSVSEFLSKADFLRLSLPAEFYRAGTALQNAWQPPPYANEAEAQTVYDTANSFMTADIKESNFPVIWSMLSNRLLTGFAYYNLTVDTIASGWRRAWGDERPADFYVSKRDITFTDPNTANVKVIAYLERGSPRIEKIRLVKEDGVWKVDSDPFVGWL